MSVEQNLQAIMNARYGRDVRQSIHDAIEDINEVAVSAQGIASTSSENARAYALMAKEYEQQSRALRDEAETFSENAFSTTPEGYETVAQKVSGLDLSVETGNKFNKAGTSKGNCLINKVYGMSVQEGVPTPSVPLDIKDFNLTLYNTGKNLVYFPYTGHPVTQFPFTYLMNGITYNFQQDGTVILNGTATSESAININTPYAGNIASELVAGRTYYITDGRESENARHPNGYVQFVLVSEDDERYWAKNTVDNKGTIIATFTNTGQVDEKFNRWGIRVCVSAGQTCNNVVIKPMVSFSDDLTYVKGRPNEKIETSIVLRALEVEANDTYNFVKNGKYYIADTLEENENGYEIIRRVGHKVFDGSENWNTTAHAISETGDTYRKTLVVSDIPSYKQLNTVLTATNKKGYVVSSAYPEAMTNDMSHPYTGAQTIALHDTNHWIQIYDERYNSNNDLADWKAHLAEEPLVVNYRLYKTEIEPISTTDAQILYNLISDDGNTILELVSDIDTDMEVMIPTTTTTATVLKGYNRAKLNSIKLEEMQTALLELGGIE